MRPGLRSSHSTGWNGCRSSLIDSAAERAAQQLEWKKLPRSDAVIIHGDFVAAVQTGGLVELPDVGLVPLRGTVPRAVGQQEALLHAVPRSRLNTRVIAE